MDHDPNNKVFAIKYVNNIKSRRVPKQWIKIKDKNVESILHTVSEVNVISSKTYFNLKNKHELKPTTCKLMAFNSSKYIPTLGEFITNVTWNSTTKPHSSR